MRRRGARARAARARGRRAARRRAARSTRPSPRDACRGRRRTSTSRDRLRTRTSGSLHGRDRVGDATWPPEPPPRPSSISLQADGCSPGTRRSHRDLLADRGRRALRRAGDGGRLDALRRRARPRRSRGSAAQLLEDAAAFRSGEPVRDPARGLDPGGQRVRRPRRRRVSSPRRRGRRRPSGSSSTT